MLLINGTKGGNVEQSFSPFFIIPNENENLNENDSHFAPTRPRS